MVVRFSTKPSNIRYHYADVMFHAVWLYYRFNLSHRDIEGLLAERGITVSYDTARL